MSARPILFSGAMVRALLEGRKTQTRRIMKPQPTPHDHSEFKKLGATWGDEPPTYYDDGSGYWCCRFCGHGTRFDGKSDHRCPYGQPGDLLWVRETWARVGTLDPGYLVYRATYPNDLPAGIENVPADIREAGYRWRPSIHMPRAASRITLELTDVRVQRVQDISEADALAEGVYSDPDVNGMLTADGNTYTGKQEGPQYAFHELFYGINKRAARDENPWVWALTFKVHRCNVDELLQKAAA